MKALIQPDGRIAQIVADADVFEVHSDLIWVDCDANITVDTHEFVDGSICAKPEVSPSPDANGFIQAVKSELGGILAISAIPSASLVFAAIQSQQWADAQVLVIDAKDKAIITLAQYDAIKSAAELFNIPIVL